MDMEKLMEEFFNDPNGEKNAEFQQSDIYFDGFCRYLNEETGTNLQALLDFAKKSPTGKLRNSRDILPWLASEFAPEDMGELVEDYENWDGFRDVLKKYLKIEAMFA